MIERIPTRYAERAFLGGERGKEQYIKKIDDTAKALTVAGLFNPDMESSVIENNLGRLVAGLSSGARSVESLRETIDRRTSTPRQVELAQNGLDILGKATFMVMRYGDNEELKDALGSGSAVEIENVLPSTLKGLGESIRSNIIDDQQLIDELNRLDKVREKVSRAGKAGEKILDAEIKKSMEKLVSVEIPDEKQDQVVMVLSYLGSEVEKPEEPVKVDTSAIEEGLKAATKAAEETTAQMQKLREEEETRRKDELKRQAQLKKEQEEAAAAAQEQGRYETFWAMLLHKNIVSIDVFQQYAPDWMKQETNKPLMQTLVALANACHYKWRYGDSNLDVMVDSRGEAIFNAPNEQMQQMYELPGVRDVMETIVHDFFDESEENGVFTLKLKNDRNIASRIQNIGNEQMNLVEDLVHDLNLSRSDAMLAVSTGFNLLYISNIFEDGDHDRVLTPCDAYVEQMRTFMYPGVKARAKQMGKVDAVGTEEGWGGQLGQWLTEVTMRAKRKIASGVGESDPDVHMYKEYERGNIHPFPERLFASFLVLTDVKTEGGQTMNLAQALYDGETVDFLASGSGSNPWGSYYDASDSANRLYKIVKGDPKAAALPLGDPKGIASVAGWAHDVADARKKVKSKDLLRPYVDTREFVKWIIAACTQGGLYQHSAELVLMTPDVLTNQDVSFDGLLKRRDLLESDDDKKWLKKEFNADGAMSRNTRKAIIRKLPKGSPLSWI